VYKGKVGPVRTMKAYAGSIRGLVPLILTFMLVVGEW
jgi:hypothetical protein